MKKTILLAVAATFALTTTAQSSSEIKQATAVLKDAQKLNDETKKMQSDIHKEVNQAKNTYNRALKLSESFDTTSVIKGDTLVLLNTKVKMVKIGEKVFSVAELGNPGTVTLNVPLQWIIANYQYLDDSKGGLTKRQVEDMQAPLKGYYDYYQYLVQQQRQSQQKQ